MDLTFKYKDLQKVVDLAKKNEGDKIILAGDDGVYFVFIAEGEKEICHANECNPEKMEFDEWWDNKRESWGGDDGSENIPIEEIETWMQEAFEMTSRTNKVWTPTIEFTPTSMKFTITTK